tara:strand:- start:19364 stop:20569 length:1206 start_codon:yes stop_codon:yes gene_type:complete
MKILYIHHCGPFGGSSRSLYEVLKLLSKNNIECIFICPSGSSAKKFRELGEVIEVKGLTKFDNTYYSHYQGIRWFVLLRELYYLPQSLLALIKVKIKHQNFNIVHFNESCLSVFGILVRLFFDSKFIVHCRTLMIGGDKIPGRLSNFLWDYLDSTYIAIDKNVAATFPARFLREEGKATIIHNGFNTNLNYDLKIKKRKPEEIFHVGFVGELHKAKGCYELTQAVINLKRKGRKINLTIVGNDEKKKKNQSIRVKILKYLGLYQNISNDIHKLLSTDETRDVVTFAGFRSDIERYYERFDVIAFPSYYDAPGRPIFEGALFGIPSIASISKPQDDTFIPNETGIHVEPRSIKAIEHAIEYMIDNPADYNNMQFKAFDLAQKNFDIKKNSKKLLSLYNEIIN